MKAIDIRRVSGADSPLYRGFLDKLRVGDTIGVMATVGNAEITSNGHVVAIEGDSLWVEVPRIDKVPRGLRRPPRSRFDVDQPSARPVRKGALKRDAPIIVFEAYPNGASVMVSGTVDALIADAFRVGDHWFDYGSTQDGKRRKLTAL